MRYHVFIEGSRDVSPAGLDVLAAALGQRYGMSPPAVVRRLKEGRFCARASLDLAAAQRLVGELEALGAHASLVGDGAPTPLGPRYESGLAAAYAGDGPRADAPLSLGPLDGGARTDTGWELTSVDGQGDAAPAMGGHGAAAAPATTLPGMPPPRGGPPPVPGRPARSTPQTGGPPPTIFQPPAPPPPAVERDPFQPDPASTALPELADMPTRVMPARPSDSSPPPGASAPPRASASSPPPRASASSSPPPRVGGATFRSPPMGLREQLADSPRARFVAGLALAFIVGLLPALGFAWSRADSAYDDIRAELQADYDAADTHERWTALAAVRDDAVALARARQQRLAISSCLLWLAAASAAAFVWFRLIDWPRPDDRA